MGPSIPRTAQLEHELTQRITQLYVDDLGHQPSSVSCQLFEATLSVVIEKAITQPEKLLVSSGHESLAKRVRQNVNSILRPKVERLVEEVTNLTVADVLMVASLESDRISLTIILNKP